MPYLTVRVSLEEMGMRKFTPEDRRQLEEFARALCNKLMHAPVAFLRELSQDGSASQDLAAVDLLRRMFRLEEEKREK